MLYSNFLVKLNGVLNMSDVYYCDIGSLQGNKIWRPLLVYLSINDVEFNLQQEQTACMTLDQLSIYLLIFAGDAVLVGFFSETEDD
jgi:hypothetical protein